MRLRRRAFVVGVIAVCLPALLLARTPALRHAFGARAGSASAASATAAIEGTLRIEPGGSRSLVVSSGKDVDVRPLKFTAKSACVVAGHDVSCADLGARAPNLISEVIVRVEGVAQGDALVVARLTVVANFAMNGTVAAPTGDGGRSLSFVYRFPGPAEHTLGLRFDEDSLCGEANPTRCDPASLTNGSPAFVQGIENNGILTVRMFRTIQTAPGSSPQ